MGEEFKWTDESVIDFVNWYLLINKLGTRYKLENQTIIDSFKKGDEPSLWNSSLIPKEEPKKFCPRCNKGTYWESEFPATYCGTCGYAEVLDVEEY